jgi:nucleoside-diphosphate-sugar epimerase
MIMIKPTIAVTGATGKTGSVVSTELLKAGYPVRAMVHREDSRSGYLDCGRGDFLRGCV